MTDLTRSKDAGNIAKAAESIVMMAEEWNKGVSILPGHEMTRGQQVALITRRLERFWPEESTETAVLLAEIDTRLAVGRSWLSDSAKSHDWQRWLELFALLERAAKALRNMGCSTGVKP